MTTMIDLRPEGEPLVIAPQIGVADVDRIAAAGFRAIICNRPDHEAGAVPSAEVRARAEALGLAFAYQPADFASMTAADGAAFRELLDTLPQPVFAYCRSGRRCAALWALGRAPEKGADAVLAAAARAGCDLRELRPRLPKGPHD